MWCEVHDKEKQPVKKTYYNNCCLKGEHFRFDKGMKRGNKDV